jgi:cellulose synthase/poly-beta-1,6-N-acetylglucosamine synthase-like glycosyltransferase
MIAGRTTQQEAHDAGSRRALRAVEVPASVYDYERFSTLAGPLQEPDEDYRVAFKPSLTRRQRATMMPLVAVNMCLATGFYLWLVQPAHLPRAAQRGWFIDVLAYVMLGGVALIEGMRLVSSFALSWWAWHAKDPVPVHSIKPLRVAFTTTIVPSKEPIEVVRATLAAAKKIRHHGVLDVWLLDEGNDPLVRAMCSELGVRHFSRHKVRKWNRPSGPYKARTKHGNHNAWLAAHGKKYDVEVSVDPDHVPLPNLCERLLGYFEDPDVAFVCGPQVYGNYNSFLTRAAESQAYLFQSVIQRAANHYAAGMFVGTNHAYRISAWRQIGGFQDSITEDMATSFAIHGAVNPGTGNDWKSVYTPDVIAVGEGPATWTDFFSQQLRWSRGTDEVLLHGGIKRFRSLSWGRRLHYALLCSYYPFVATGWMLGLLLAGVYVTTGATGLHLTHLGSWFTLYADLAIVQASLYFWLRRLNVSPHEEEGSAGISGMFVSMLATPIYVTAFIGSALKRPMQFVVTPKGDRASPDHLGTFRKHLCWAAIALVVGVVALFGGRALWAALLAPTICLFVSCTPIALWAWRHRHTPPADTPTLTAALAEDDDLLTEVTA